MLQSAGMRAPGRTRCAVVGAGEHLWAPAARTGLNASAARAPMQQVIALRKKYLSPGEALARRRTARCWARTPVLHRPVAITQTHSVSRGRTPASRSRPRATQACRMLLPTLPPPGRGSPR